MSDKPKQPIVIVKRADVNVNSDKARLLKRVDDLESEFGRAMKLLRELRADVIHLTTE